VLLLNSMSAFGASPPEPRPPLDEVLARLDHLFRGTTAYAELRMSIVTPNWERTLEVRCWSEGLDKTFMVLDAPKKDKGIATLRLGTEMWNYFPRIDKEMKIPPSMMLGSWMGSDFTNDDLVKEASLLRDYQARYAESEVPGRLVLELTPRQGTVSLWGRIVTTLDAATLLPLREVYHDEHGKAVRELVFSEPRDFGGRTVPTVLTLHPLTKPGHKTVIRYEKLSLDQPLPDGVFSLRNLRAKH